MRLEREESHKLQDVSKILLPLVHTAGQLLQPLRIPADGEGKPLHLAGGLPYGQDLIDSICVRSDVRDDTAKALCLLRPQVRKTVPLLVVDEHQEFR